MAPNGPAKRVRVSLNFVRTSCSDFKNESINLTVVPCSWANIYMR